MSSQSEESPPAQESSRSSPNQFQSQEASSTMVAAVIPTDESVKSLSEKLSVALRNINTKDEIVKQHTKVAEEAVAGWEKAETEAAAFKQQLESVVKQKSALEERVGHLDGALKECVRQLRLAREEQEQNVHEALERKNREWDAVKLDLETRVFQLEGHLNAAQDASSSSEAKLENLQHEITVLSQELIVCRRELNLRSMESDLSTQSAESASKQHLESIKKLAKLEAECRRLRAIARKSSPTHTWQTPQAISQEVDHRSVSSSVFQDSIADSLSDSGDRLLSIEHDLHELRAGPSKPGSSEFNDREPSCSDSWASALIAELDQFRDGKAINRSHMVTRNLDLMDDFLEMEKLAANENGTTAQNRENGGSSETKVGSLTKELEVMQQRVTLLEEQVENLKVERIDLRAALTDCEEQLETSVARLREAEPKVAELQRQLISANEVKQALETDVENMIKQKMSLELELGNASEENQILKTNVQALETALMEEKDSSGSYHAKCQDLEEELNQRRNREQEVQRLLATNANGELKMRQEKELAVAAGKLAECQKTIASLGVQLKALASIDNQTLDDANTSDPCDADCSYSVNDVEPILFTREASPLSGSSSSSSSSTKPSAFERNGGAGCGRLFSLSRSVSRVDGQ